MQSIVWVRFMLCYQSNWLEIGLSKESRFMRKWGWLGTAILFCWHLPVFGLLHLQLTKGVDAATPIHIASFRVESTDEKEGTGSRPAAEATKSAAKVTAILRHDFSLSGRFRVVTEQAQKPEYWVEGQVTQLPSGRLQITYRCKDLFDESGRELLHRRWVISKTALEHVSHRISDKIYQAITGDQGIFSTRLAYVVLAKDSAGKRHYSLKVSDYDGNHAHMVTGSSEPLMSPVWSPDGQRLAYVSFEQGHAGIYEQILASGKRRMLIAIPGINGAPAYSPDGKRMALVLSKQKHPKIYLMTLSDLKVSQVTEGNAIDTEPRWLPDGSGLIFTSNRGGGVQLYRYDLKSKGLRRLTFKGPYNVHANMDANQRQLVYHHRTNEGDTIVSQSLQRGRVRLLTKAGAVESPSLSPNGKMVVFTMLRQGRSVLGMASLDAKMQWVLPADEGEVREPAWSPFMPSLSINEGEEQ